MVYAELVDLIQKKDTSARQKWYETFIEKLGPVALRYAKSEEQANAMLPVALHGCYERMSELREGSEETVLKNFITECVAFVRNIRNEYFVASTVYATSQAEPANYDLFENNERPDFNSASPEQLIGALQKLVPAQRLIFNLHIIDGYSLYEAAALLESSEQTVKSNLEKARYNLQKNLEIGIKNAKS